jgi:hypothetical protein
MYYGVIYRFYRCHGIPRGYLGYFSLKELAVMGYHQTDDSTVVTGFQGVTWVTRA